MYEIEMQEMSREFFPIWQAAGEHLDAQVDGGIQSWLRAHPYPPVLEHLSFRLGNQLFFIQVEDAEGRIKGPGSRRGLLAVARGTNGHACALPMRKRMLRSSWALAPAARDVGDEQRCVFVFVCVCVCVPSTGVALTSGLCERHLPAQARQGSRPTSRPHCGGRRHCWCWLVNATQWGLPV